MVKQFLPYDEWPRLSFNTKQIQQDPYTKKKTRQASRVTNPSCSLEGRSQIKVSFEHLNHLFIAFIPVADWAGQVAENEFLFLGTSWNIAFSTSPKSQFGLFNRLKRSSLCLATTWNIAFSNSPKNNFEFVQRTKMSSRCHANHWNIDFSSLSKSHFGLVKKQKKSSKVPFDLLKYGFIDFKNVSFYAYKDYEKEFKDSSTACNIAFSTSPKLHFWIVKK